MKHIYSIAWLIIGLLFQSCALTEDDSEIGTTIVGNGIISGVVVPPQTGSMAKRRAEAFGYTVYLFDSDVIQDSMLSNDGYFEFRNLQTGIYSVLAKDRYGLTARIDSIPIDSANTQPLKIILHLSIETVDSSAGSGKDSLDMGDSLAIIFDTLYLKTDAPGAQDASIYFALANDYSTRKTGTWGTKNEGQSSCVAGAAYDQSTIFRPLFQFAIPDSLKSYSIYSATLSLAPLEWVSKTSTAPVSWSVHKILKSWKEGSGTAGCGISPRMDNSSTVDGVTGIDRYWDVSGEARWNEIGIGLDDKDASSHSYAIGTMVQKQDSPLELDLRSLVEEWIQSPSSNHGLLLRNLEELSTTYRGYPHFHSGEASEPTKRPTLRVIISHYDTIAADTSLPAEPVTSDTIIQLRPGPEESQDATIFRTLNGEPGTYGSYNTGAGPCIACATYDPSTLFRSLIRFELAKAVPSDRKLVKAYLLLTPEPNGWVEKSGNAYYTLAAHKLLRSWKEGSGALPCDGEPQSVNSESINGVTGLDRYYSADSSARWNQIGVGLDGVDAIATPAAKDSILVKSGSQLSLDLTALVQDWIANPSTNYGVLLRNPDDLTTNYQSYPHFHSGESETASARPTLTLIFE